MKSKKIKRLDWKIMDIYNNKFKVYRKKATFRYIEN